jgi:hypothetical protein
LGRNFLHAAKIGFTQPRSGEHIEIVAPFPAQLREYLSRLAEAAGEQTRRIDVALNGFL